MSDEYNDRRRRLLESRPTRDGFFSDAEYEEALGYWNHHQGRILRLHDEQEYMRKHKITFEEMVRRRSRGELWQSPQDEPEETPEQSIEDWEV